MSKKQMNWLLSELSQFDSYSLVVLVSSRHWIGEGEVVSRILFFDNILRRVRSLGMDSPKIVNY
jgi:hypothetical protein